MEHQHKAPLSTGIIEGIGWGVVTSLALGTVVAAACAAVTVVSGGITPLVTTMAFAGGAASEIGGLANGIKTIVEKRTEYEQAHNTIQTEGAVLDGKVQSMAQSRGR